MTMTHALAAGATVVALAFAACLYERWLVRRRRHELAWTVALLLFAAGSLSLWAGAALGWDPVTFRLFYLFGAILNVPFLALGTVYLLGGRRLGDTVAVVTVLLAAFAAGVVTVAPLNGPIDPGTLPQGSDVLGVLPRVLAAVASGVGALVVFAGAVWSAVRLLATASRSQPGAGRLAAGNLVIALGTAVLTASGLLNSVLGEMEAFAATLTAGATILFAGFLVATAPPARAVARPALLAHRADSSVSDAGPAGAPSRPTRAGSSPRW